MNQNKFIEELKKINIDLDSDKFETTLEEDVKLKKGTFIHGLGGSSDNDFSIFDYVVENGSVSGSANAELVSSYLNVLGDGFYRNNTYGITVRLPS